MRDQLGGITRRVSQSTSRQEEERRPQRGGWSGTGQSWCGEDMLPAGHLGTAVHQSQSLKTVFRMQALCLWGTRGVTVPTTTATARPTAMPRCLVGLAHTPHGCIHTQVVQYSHPKSPRASHRCKGKATWQMCWPCLTHGCPVAGRREHQQPRVPEQRVRVARALTAP